MSDARAPHTLTADHRRDPRNVVGRADGERGRRPGPRGLLLRRARLTNNHEQSESYTRPIGTSQGVRRRGGGRPRPGLSRERERESRPILAGLGTFLVTIQQNSQYNGTSEGQRRPTAPNACEWAPAAGWIKRNGLGAFRPAFRPSLPAGDCFGRIACTRLLALGTRGLLARGFVAEKFPLDGVRSPLRVWRALSGVCGAVLGDSSHTRRAPRENASIAPCTSPALSCPLTRSLFFSRR